MLLRDPALSQADKSTKCSSLIALSSHCTKKKYKIKKGQGKTDEYCGKDKQIAKMFKWSVSQDFWPSFSTKHVISNSAFCFHFEKIFGFNVRKFITGKCR